MDYNIQMCSNIGVSGTTECYVKSTAAGVYEARMGFSLIGHTNMTQEQFNACDCNPFHDEFHDNFAKGVGSSEEEAIASLKKDLKDIADRLWM